MELSQFIGLLGGGGFTIIAFIIALSVIVAIHEYGHYIVGRWCGIHAEVFSIGFGPVLLSRTDRHGTVWQIAALPFGGYVKFLGDANAASVGSDTPEQTVDSRRTMAGAPLWARAATVAAGPIFNFILAILIFAGYLMSLGKPVDPATFAGEHPLPAEMVSELRAGDELIAVGGIELGAAEIADLPVVERQIYTVGRDGDVLTVEGPPLVPSRISGLTPRSAADEAGLKIDDVIVGIDGNSIAAFDQIVEAVTAAEGDPLELRVWRDGQELDFTLAPRRSDLPLPEGGFETRWLIGISGNVFFEEMTERVGVWEALTQGTEQLWWRITTSLSGLWHIITGGISTCNLSGPVAIAQASGSMASQGGGSFILFIGMLSAAVGLLNLFPIPVLDGGHLVFYAYEAVARRKPTERALQVLMFAGLTVIGALMIFALLNDLVLCP